MCGLPRSALARLSRREPRTSTGPLQRRAMHVLSSEQGGPSGIPHASPCRLGRRSLRRVSHAVPAGAGGGPSDRYARSDHTIPIPRPAADEAEGVTSACRQCHVAETPDRLETQVRAWYGTLKPPAPREFALTEFFEDSLEPDMPSLSKDVVQRLEGLAQSNDLDERALALASLHLARGEDPWVRRFLAGEIAHLDSLDDAVRKRWSIALGCVADRYRPRGDPGLAPAHFALAQGYLLAGDARAATRELRLGLDFDPDNAAARQLLEQIERATGGR